MKKVDRIILGAGVAGLCVAWFSEKKDYIILSADVGGKIVNSLPFPKYLHNDKLNSYLVEKVLKASKKEIASKIKNCNIGFLLRGKIRKECSSKDRERYYRKSRGLSTKAPTPSSVMSGGNSSFEYLDYDMSKLVQVMGRKLKSKIVLGDITKIDLKKQIIETGKDCYHYNSLISTINLKSFLYLAGRQKTAIKLQSKFVTYVLTNNFCSIKPFNYIYIPERKYKYHRISKVKRKRLLVELLGRYNQKELEKILPENARIISCQSLPNQLIPCKMKLKLPKNVTLVGRYATWKHSILTQDMLRSIQ